jgi:CDP-diacylglycerol--serine O-phosphatidyltransferase
VLHSLPGRRQDDRRPQRFRRGVILLPSIFTVANLFCGYGCVVYATQRDFDTAAVLIGIAMVLDTLDGFVARLTKSSTEFGVQLDSLADVVSFGLAPAILAYAWGLWPLRRLGWAAGFIYLTAAAMRLARFNIQSAGVTDKRYFVGMPSPAAAAVIAATVYLFPDGPHDRQTALAALAMVVVPGLLMVSTIRFRSVKAIDMGWQRSYFALFLIAVAIALIASYPRYALVVLAYTYMLFALLTWVINKARRRPVEVHAADPGAGDIHIVQPGDGRDQPSNERAG